MLKFLFLFIEEKFIPFVTKTMHDVALPVLRENA